MTTKRKRVYLTGTSAVKMHHMFIAWAIDESFFRYCEVSDGG